MSSEVKRSRKRSPRIKCLKCETEKAVHNYYDNKNPLFVSDKTSVCKSCIAEYIDEGNSAGYIDRVKLTLSLLNRPYIADVWYQCNETWSKYISQISSLRHLSQLDFKDSESFNASIVAEEDAMETDEIIFVTPKMRLFWRGYQDEEIVILEDYFRELTSTYESNTPIQKSLYRNMAITQYMADNTKSATEFDKLMKTLSGLMNDANVKPVQASGANDSGISTWGEWVKKIEETEPIPAPREEFKDVDNIFKYMTKWFVGHLAKVFGYETDKNKVANTIDELTSESVD